MGYEEQSRAKKREKLMPIFPLQIKGKIGEGKLPSICNLQASPRFHLAPKSSFQRFLIYGHSEKKALPICPVEVPVCRGSVKYYLTLINLFCWCLCDVS